MKLVYGITKSGLVLWIPSRPLVVRRSLLLERPGVSQVRKITLVFVVGIQKSLCVAKGPDKRLMITNVMMGIYNYCSREYWQGS